VEKQYIVGETRSQFRVHREIADPREIAKKLEHGNSRLDIAVHYGIPYERLEHAPLCGGSEAKHMGAPVAEGEEGPSDEAYKAAARLRIAANKPINPLAAAARAKQRERLSKLKLQADREMS